MEANRQGSFYKTLEVTRNEEGTSNTILGSEFLKKTENYSVLVANFVTNVIPPLNDSTEVAFQIFVRGTPQQSAAQAVFPAFWRLEDTQFTPSPVHSTIEWLRQAQQFFHRFTFLARMIGISPDQGAAVGTLAQANLGAADRAEGYPFVHTNYVGGVNRGWGDLDTGPVTFTDALVSCKMKSDGSFQLDMTTDFANNFYILVGERTQQMLGLNDSIHLVVPAAVLFGIPSETEPLFADPVLPAAALFSPEVATVVLEAASVTSANAMHSLDERMSLDVVATLPISNKILSVDGGEEHEYLLGRFDLNDLNRFQTLLEATEDRLMDTTVVKEAVDVGLQDLTEKSANTSSIQMLPGSVQQTNFRLYTRYWSDGRIVVSPTVVGTGFWSIKLIFGKKI